MSKKITSNVEAYRFLASITEPKDLSLISRADVIALDNDYNFLYRIGFNTVYQFYNRTRDIFTIIRKTDEENSVKTQRIFFAENSIFPRSVYGNEHIDFVNKLIDDTTKSKLCFEDHLLMTSNGFVSFKDNGLKLGMK